MTQVALESTENFLLYLLDKFPLQESVQQLCNYLTEQTSCDKIVLYEIDREQLQTRTIFEYTQDAYIGRPKTQSITHIYPIEDLLIYQEEPQEIRYFNELRLSKFHNRYRRIYPAGKSVLEYRLHQKTERSKLQAFFLFSNKINAFTDEHVEIVRSLQKPIHQMCTQMINIYGEHSLSLSSTKAITSDPEELIRQCPGLTKLYEQINIVAPVDSTVLIYGETGVGKEIVADAIYSLSSRSEEVFQKLNCGTLTPTLIDSELFGVVKGAYTGAIETKKGIFEAAHGGTLYLDEIGELSLDAQVRLLRVLEAKEIRRVGDTKRIPIDVRIITATNKDLESMVAQGTFRGDLLYRLQVIPLYIPSLKERPEDISILARYFYDLLIQQYSITNPPKLTKKNMRELQKHSWAGNVRQLKYTMERSLVFARNQKELTIIDPIRPLCTQTILNNSPPNVSSLLSNLSVLPVLSGLPALSDVNTINPQCLEIIAALHRSHGRIEGSHGAAKILSLHPATFRYKMKKFGIVRQKKSN